jgi:energy-coupling factor transporter transmembrane protein EcfT
MCSWSSSNSGCPLKNSDEGVGGSFLTAVSKLARNSRRKKNNWRCVYVSLCLCVCVCLFLSLSLSLCPSLSVSLCLSLFLFVCLWVRLRHFWLHQNSQFHFILFYFISLSFEVLIYSHRENTCELVNLN